MRHREWAVLRLGPSNGLGRRRARCRHSRRRRNASRLRLGALHRRSGALCLSLAAFAEGASGETMLSTTRANGSPPMQPSAINACASSASRADEMRKSICMDTCNATVERKLPLSADCRSVGALQEAALSRRGGSTALGQHRPHCTPLRRQPGCCGATPPAAAACRMIPPLPGWCAHTHETQREGV